MVKMARMSFWAILLAAFPAIALAQNGKAILDNAAQAIGAKNLKTLQYSASGSIYDEKGQHIIVNSYLKQLDLNARTSSVQMTLMQGTAPPTINQSGGTNSSWPEQLDFWLTPYGFIKGATENDVTAETKTVEGETYQVLTFTLPGNHRIAGYINSQNMIERVEARTENDVLIQGIYREYETFNGLKVPTVIVQRRAGKLSQVLIVKDAKPNV